MQIKATKDLNKKSAYEKQKGEAKLAQDIKAIRSEAQEARNSTKLELGELQNKMHAADTDRPMMNGVAPNDLEVTQAKRVAVDA